MPQQLQTHSALTGSPPPEPPDPASAGRKKQWLWVAALLVVAFGLVGWQVYGSYAKARQRNQMAGAGRPMMGGGMGGMGGGQQLTPEERRKQRLDSYTQELSLTDAQKTQLEAIMKEYEPKMAALRDLPRDQAVTARQKLRAEQGAKIKAALTPEQQTKYDAMIAQMRQRFQGMGGGMGGPGGPGGRGGGMGGPGMGGGGMGGGGMGGGMGGPHMGGPGTVAPPPMAPPQGQPPTANPQAPPVSNSGGTTL